MEMSDYRKEMTDAFLSTAKMATEGMTSIQAEMFGFGKSRMETGVAAMEAMFGADTIKEALELQGDFMKSALESYIEESGKLGEMTAKMTGELVESFKKSASA